MYWYCIHLKGRLVARNQGRRN